jgi:hypothetical protein
MNPAAVADMCKRAAIVFQHALTRFDDINPNLSTTYILVCRQICPIQPRESKKCRFKVRAFKEFKSTSSASRYSFAL